MKRAVNELIRTPQNNFRVFRNGSPIFGGDIDGCSFEEFCEHLCPAIRGDERFENIEISE